MAQLPDNHVTLANLHITSCEGATVIKFGQKVQDLDRSSLEMVVTSLSYNHVTQL